MLSESVSADSVGSFGKASILSGTPSPSVSFKKAAKAYPLEKIVETSLDTSTPLESPPSPELPQVTTELSFLRAAKAEAVEKIVETSLDTSTPLESPPSPELPQVTTEPSFLRAAKAETVE